MAYEDFINENIAPYAATKIGVYDSEGNKVGVIPLGNFKPEYGDRLYRFGVLSDVHNQSDQLAESTADLQRALSIFNEKESVIMTCICGDISQNGTASEFGIYKNNVDAKSPNTPVYTTVGNHDATSSGLNLDNWNTYTGNHGRSFEVTQGNDHFLFFGMNYWSLGGDGTPYIEEDMAWLEEKLETYRNERCFIFTHLFFPDRAGNLNGIYPPGNWLGGAQLTRIQGLCDHYKNTIWFSGHSHWKWYLQKYQDRANIYRNNCGWCVHIPSCASPIDSNGSSRVSMPLESEGAIVDVYENYIDIRGMDLKNEKYLPIAQYRLDTTLVEIPAKDTPGEGQTGLTWHYDTLIDKNNGSISTSTSYCASDFIEVNEGDVIDVVTTINTTSPNYEVKLCYYDNSQNFISCDTNALIKTTQSIFRGQSTIGNGIKYIRIRCFANGASNQHTLVNSLTLNTLNEANAYNVTNNLTNCVTSNSSTFVLKNSSYTSILTPNTGYTLDTVTVTMGDVDVTSTVYESTTKTISINNATGNIVISATCTEQIVNVLYELAEETVFNGTDTYIDTGIDLLSADRIDKDWTMLVDFTSNSTEKDKNILHCMKESNPFPGLCLDFGSRGLRVVIPNSSTIQISPPDTNRHKFVITKSGNTFTVYNESMSQLGTNTPDTITTVTQTLLLGANQNANGDKGRFFNGTIHKFKLAEGVMTREYCLAWISTTI